MSGWIYIGESATKAKYYIKAKSNKDLEQQDFFSNDKITLQEFAKKVKEKHPQYMNVDDIALAKEVIEKYPYYKNKVNLSIQQPEIEKDNSHSGNFTFWVKFAYPSQKIKNKKGGWITKQSEYSLERWSIYCETKKYAILSYVDYNSKGEVISSEKLYGEIKDIVPETVAEGIYSKVCGR